MRATIPAALLMGAALVVAAYFVAGRYSAQLVPGNPPMVMRTDRLTGEVLWCSEVSCETVVPAGRPANLRH